MSFPYHLQLEEKIVLGRKWGKASVISQRASSIARGVDAETARMRSLHDSRGQLIREGTTYYNQGAKNWQVARSYRGRVDQVDLVVNGEVRKTCGIRALCRWARLP